LDNQDEFLCFSYCSSILELHIALLFHDLTQCSLITIIDGLWINSGQGASISILDGAYKEFH
jgi:hypothetical protein